MKKKKTLKFPNISINLTTILYNKGTLIGNWKEERDIKEATGISRKIPG
jgi:hypothetical protein